MGTETGAALAGSVPGPGVPEREGAVERSELVREGAVAEVPEGEEDGRGGDGGRRTESHTSQRVIEWWLRKVQTGQARRAPVSVGSRGAAAGAGCGSGRGGRGGGGGVP